MKRLIANVLAGLGIAVVATFSIRQLLRGVIDALDRVDEIAQRQAARHAYGPLVAIPEPRDGEAISGYDMQAGADVTGTDDEISRHRFAPGKRPWDDDVLESQFADPLMHVIDNPFAEDGAMPIMQPLGSPIVFEDRGGGRETEV